MFCLFFLVLQDIKQILILKYFKRVSSFSAYFVTSSAIIADRRIVVYQCWSYMHLITIYLLVHSINLNVSHHSNEYYHDVETSYWHNIPTFLSARCVEVCLCYRDALSKAICQCMLSMPKLMKNSACGLIFIIKMIRATHGQSISLNMTLP